MIPRLSMAWGVSMAGASLDPQSFNRWKSMIRRCYDSKYKDYPRYGGRGIGVCDRWLRFPDYLSDVGPRPPGMSLDRIDNDGDYSPANTRWATPSMQALNQRDPLALRTHCPCGHPYDELNTIVVRGGARQCRECSRLRKERRRRDAGVPVGSPAQHNKAKTHCHRGHAFDEANTSIDAKGARRCLTCGREATRRYRAQHALVVTYR